MARQEHVLTVFVASPADVADERGKLEDVIRELNLTWSRELSVRLDLVRWETHAYPGMAVDPQAVINEQIPDDFDIFVGIMWCRYGTVTGRAGSGTVEEFERAKARYDADPACVKLMVYFKDEQLQPSRIDPNQLAKVDGFRNSLGDEGALYWRFTEIDQFEQLIRLHLTRQVQAWKKTFGQPGATVEARPTAAGVVPLENGQEGDDLGILELVEISEDRFEELRSISERIAKATENLGEKMEDRTAEMETLRRDSQGNANRKDAKRLMTKAASDMEQYTAHVEAELPLFSDALNTGMNSLVRATTMSVDVKSDDADTDQAKQGLDVIVNLLGVLATIILSTGEFRRTIAAMPRLTTDLNRARRGVTGVLDRLLEEFEKGERLLEESEKVIRELLDE